MYKRLCCACCLLDAALTGSPDSVCLHMNTICSLLVPLLTSPLAAPRVSQVFLRLGEAAFNDKQLGKKSEQPFTYF